MRLPELLRLRSKGDAARTCDQHCLHGFSGGRVGDNVPIYEGVPSGRRKGITDNRSLGKLMRPIADERWKVGDVALFMPAIARRWLMRRARR